MKKRIIVCLIALIMLFGAGCGKKKDNRLPSSLDESKFGEFEVAEFGKTYTQDGIYTTYQIGRSYSDNHAVPTDSVMAYVSDSSDSVNNIVQSYIGKGYKQVDVMLPNGRDMFSYYIDGKYDGKTHYDIIQRDRSGAYHRHSEGSYYVHPDKNFSEYLASIAKKAITAGAKDVYIEEPDGYVDYCYSDYFKALWKEKYGEDWEYDEEDMSQASKQNEIIADMFVKSYGYIAAAIKKDYPQSKVYIATHPVYSYCVGGIVADNGRMIALEDIDGVIGQSWTNTSMVPFYYEGDKVVQHFETSYLEYSEAVNYVVGNGKKAFMLNDASADGGFDYETTRPIWEHNIVAQMLMPDAYCYESTVWAERAFTGAPVDYRAVQEGIYRIQGDIHNYASKTYGGTNGIGVVMSYTASSSFTSGSDYLGAMVTPLIKQGIPVDVITLETLTDINALKNIKVLVLSYDFIKPTDLKYNEVIAEWVKCGGTLLYLGGYNFAQTFDGVWQDAGCSSPQAHLFSKLGMDVSFSQFSGNKKLTASSIAPKYITDYNAFATTRFMFTEYAAADSAKTLLTADDKTVCFEQAVDKGDVIVCGIEPRGMSGFKDAFGFYEMIIKRACDLAEIGYHAPKAMYTERGDYLFAHTFDRTLTLEGTYVDLFDSGYSVCVNPQIKKESSRAFVRVDNAADGIAFSNSAAEASKNDETALNYIAANTAQSKALAVIKIPQGSAVANVSAAFVKTQSVPNEFKYSESNGYLIISYKINRADSVAVSITYA